MKRLLALFLCLWLPVAEAAPFLINSYRFTGGGGGGGGTFGPLTFDGSGESLGTGWTDDVRGDWDRNTDTARPVTTGFAPNIAVYSGTNVGANCWAKITINDVGGSFTGFIFRYTASSSAFYAITRSAGGTWTWESYTDVDASGVTIDSGSITSDDPDVYGVTLTGTGTGTELRIWKNPTGSPSSATDWNGDTTPDLFLQGDPSAPVNTGSFVGLLGYTNATPNIYDDMSGGSL